MIFNQLQEKIDEEQLLQLQLERLQMTLNRVYRNVAFYKQTLEREKIMPEDIRSLADLKRLPFTTRADLVAAYPYNMFAVPLRDIVRLHSTSGTVGKPIVVGYTKNDLARWTECAARVLAAADVTEHDVVQIAHHYDLSTGGFGFQQGAERIGASVTPAAAATPIEKQIIIMRDFKTTVLISTPSLALRLAHELEELKLHPEYLFLRVGVFGGEPWSEQLRVELENRLHLKAFDAYGLTEVAGPGIASECEAREGLHVNEDHFIVEIVDPATGESLEPGEQGELVFTTITKEGFPLLRYRTGDIACLIPAPCRCGRGFRRISRIVGRTDDLIFYRGKKIFPSEIETLLLSIPGLTAHYQIILERLGEEDMLELQVELPRDLLTDSLKDLELLRDRLLNKLEEELGAPVKILLVEPKALAQTGTAKINRVIDKRKG